VETRTTDGSATPDAEKAGAGRVTQRTGSPAVSAASKPVVGSATIATPAVPRPGGDGQGRSTPVGTYVANSFTGDITMTSGGTPALAHDGEPAGLARVTLAMREQARDSSPAPRRLVALACWAAGLGILGAILAIWDGITMLVGAPGWFLPTVAAMGVAGVGLTMGAFLTARARAVPWVLLGAASTTLLVAFISTVIAG
jgi:hypothetical protein